tara:strand:- start:16 stop:750 length:735 start_codon:yes stop_codon:yes gene_type:complete
VKYLITGGCSFSMMHLTADHDPDWNPAKSPINITWVKHLDNYLEISTIHTGSAAVGNGFISRRVMEEVDKLLRKGINPEDILVAIMWSAPKRYQHFWDGEWFILSTITRDRHPDMRRDLLGQESEASNIWFDKFFDSVGCQIRSWQEINATQDYFKRVNVNYFMMNFFSYVVEEHKEDPNVSWLRDRIDTSKWPLWPQGQWDWIQENALDLPYDEDGNHPGEKQHMRWTEQVIIPYLKDTYDTL